MSLRSATGDGGSWWRFIGFSALLTACVTVGLVTLVYYDRWLRARAAPRPEGPGAATANGIAFHSGPIARLSEPRRLAFFIALGIGFHNFSEDLAIGQSAASGEISLALLLIVGFGLHNATEGFGIVAPLAAEDDRPSWAFLGVMGLIGGGPTFIGTIVGRAWVNEWLFTAFFGLAAGSILYVVIELLGVGAHSATRSLRPGESCSDSSSASPPTWSWSLPGPDAPDRGRGPGARFHLRFGRDQHSFATHRTGVDPSHGEQPNAEAALRLV